MVCRVVAYGSRAGCGRCNGSGTLPAVFATPWQLWHGRPGLMHRSHGQEALYRLLYQAKRGCSAGQKLFV